MRCAKIGRALRVPPAATEQTLASTRDHTSGTPISAKIITDAINTIAANDIILPHLHRMFFLQLSECHARY